MSFKDRILWKEHLLKLVQWPADITIRFLHDSDAALTGIDQAFLSMLLTIARSNPGKSGLVEAEQPAVAAKGPRGMNYIIAYEDSSRYVEKLDLFEWLWSNAGKRPGHTVVAPYLKNCDCEKNLDKLFELEGDQEQRDKYAYNGRKCADWETRTDN